MRPVLYSDVSAAARALLSVEPDARVRRCAELIAKADLADRFTRRLGRLHPCFGNGTLQDAARRHVLGPELSFDDPAYLACFIVVLNMLRARNM